MLVRFLYLFGPDSSWSGISTIVPALVRARSRFKKFLRSWSGPRFISLPALVLVVISSSTFDSFVKCRWIDCTFHQNGLIRIHPSELTWFHRNLFMSPCWTKYIERGACSFQRLVFKGMFILPWNRIAKIKVNSNNQEEKPWGINLNFASNRWTIPILWTRKRDFSNIICIFIVDYVWIG